MKKGIALIETGIILACLAVIPAMADDYSNYSEEQLESEITKLEGQLEELKNLRDVKQKETEKETEQKVSSTDGGDDAITFQGVPWLSTTSDVEELTGLVANPIYVSNKFACPRELVDHPYQENGGISVHYFDVNVAGYEASYTNLDYMYPIIDGKIIRNDDEAQLFYAEYEFRSSDFGDLQAVYDDLMGKLQALYGDGDNQDDEYQFITIWSDSVGNVICMSAYRDMPLFDIGYMYLEANEMNNTMYDALNAEAVQEEQAIRESNENNTSGL